MFNETFLNIKNSIKNFFLEKPPERYKECIFCGKELREKYQRKFCSDKCKYSYYNNLRNKDKIDFSKKYCKICGKEINRIERPRSNFCSHKCCCSNYNKKDYKKNKLKYIKKNQKFYDNNKVHIIKRVRNRQIETNYKSEKSNKQRKERYIKKRTRTLFPIKNQLCEFCGKPSTEHHHNTNPIEIDKFNFVCHSCHVICHRSEKQQNLLKGGKK